MRIVLAFAIVLAAVQTAVTAASPTTLEQVQRRPALEAGIVREVNRARVGQGLEPLQSSPGLRSAARGHSKSMLELGFFGHESADGTAFSARIRRHYPSRGWTSWAVGEALVTTAGRTADVSDLVDAWLDSPSHREIILSPAWHDVGVGALYAPSAPRAFGDAETIVVTADFGLRLGRSDPS